MTSWRTPSRDHRVVVEDRERLLDHRSPVRAGRRPPLRGARVRPGQRRGDPVAAPVLVLRRSRGLHRRPCRSSASSPRSSRYSAASRCSGTRAWSTPWSRSPPCPRRCGRTRCTPPAPVDQPGAVPGPDRPAPDDLEFSEIPIGNLPLYNPDHDADYPRRRSRSRTLSHAPTRCCPSHRSTTAPSPAP
jgi:hypothetical protein